MQIRRALAVYVVLALVGAAATTTTLAQKNDEKKQPKRSKAEQADVDALVKLVDSAAADQAVPTQVPIAWESNHFVKGQDGSTYIPFTITVDRAQLSSPGVALYVRVVSKGAAAEPAPAADAKKDEGKPAARPVNPWDSINFIEVPSEGKVSRAIMLKPGEYDAYVAIKEKGTDKKNAPPAKIGLMKHPLTVPDFAATGLMTSSVILAQTVEPVTGTLTPAQQEENPYVFGPMKIVPSGDGKFSKAGELQVIFWIYGAGEAAGGKPDVAVDFSFHQKLPEGEKYFNKTAPQQLNAQTLPPEFSVAAGHQLPGSLVVPLTSFPAGDYRLEIKVTDKPSGKAVTQNVNFTVVS